MNSARARGRRRIGQATAALSALGVIITGGASTLAWHSLHPQTADGTASCTATSDRSTGRSGHVAVSRSGNARLTLQPGDGGSAVARSGGS